MKPWSFAIHFVSCVGHRSGDTARLSWIPYELCRELRYAATMYLNQRYAAKRATPQHKMLCLSAQSLLSEKCLAQINDWGPRYHRCQSSRRTEGIVGV